MERAHRVNIGVVTETNAYAGARGYWLPGPKCPYRPITGGRACDADIAAFAARVVMMRDGSIVSDQAREARLAAPPVALGNAS